MGWCIYPTNRVMPERVTTIGSGYEGFLDTLAFFLASAPVFSKQPDTTVVHWVLGDIGMGSVPGLPVAFIAPLNDAIVPYGKGGSTGGRHGTDMDDYQVPLLIIQAEHKVEEAIPATVIPAAPFYEMPGYRDLMTLVQDVRAALRVEPTFGGAVATSTITESRPMLIELDNKIYRGARMTINARDRRSRG